VAVRETKQRTRSTSVNRRSRLPPFTEDG
jgi:hypothetical protein